jgi:hypothetical protein
MPRRRRCLYLRTLAAALGVLGVTWAGTAAQRPNVSQCHAPTTEVEKVITARSVPPGFPWIDGPFNDRVPRPGPTPGMSSTGARSHGPTGHRPAEPSYDRGSTAVRRQSSRAVGTARPPRRRWAECRRGRTRKWADWAGREPVLKGQPAQRWSTPVNASVLLRSLGHQPPGKWAYWAGFFEVPLIPPRRLSGKLRGVFGSNLNLLMLFAA